MKLFTLGFGLFDNETVNFIDVDGRLSKAEKEGRVCVVSNPKLLLLYRILSLQASIEIDNGFKNLVNKYVMTEKELIILLGKRNYCKLCSTTIDTIYVVLKL